MQQNTPHVSILFNDFIHKINILRVLKERFNKLNKSNNRLGFECITELLPVEKGCH